jgi:Trm5-related predicted tRNA methylase
MVELLIGTLVGIVLTSILVFKYFLEQLIRLNDEQQQRLLKIAEKQQGLSKSLIDFIDKNINERVIYPDPNATAYSNEHKMEKETDEEEEVFEMPEDMTAEELREQMESNKEGK